LARLPQEDMSHQRRVPALLSSMNSHLGPGDFMGFPAPGIAHLLRNPFEEDLVYLMGGEAVPLDVLDYPTLGKRFLLHYAGGPPDFYELAAPSKPFGLADPPSER